MFGYTAQAALTVLRAFAKLSLLTVIEGEALMPSFLMTLMLIWVNYSVGPSFRRPDRARTSTPLLEAMNCGGLHL